MKDFVVGNDIGSEGGLSVGSIGVVSPNESVVVLSEAKGGQDVSQGVDGRQTQQTKRTSV